MVTSQRLNESLSISFDEAVLVVCNDFNTTKHSFTSLYSEQERAHCALLAQNATKVWLGVVQTITNNESLVWNLKCAIMRLGLAKPVHLAISVGETLLSATKDMSPDSTVQDFIGRLQDDEEIYTSGLFPIFKDMIRYAYLCDMANGTDPLLKETTGFRNSLQVLFFLERFTYPVGDSKGTYDKFLAANKSCKNIERNWSIQPGQYVWDMLRAELRSVLREKPPVELYPDGYFSSGSTTDGGRSLLGKVQALAKSMTFLHGNMTHTLPHSSNGTPYRLKGYYPQALAVPKNFTSKRIIAPESARVNYFGHAALDALRLRLEITGASKFINEHEQSVNREWAMQSSFTAESATIDMSSASDTISEFIFINSLPAAWRSWYLEYTSMYIQMPEEKFPRRLYMLFSSGNPLTWLTEAVWFLCLGRVACLLAGCDPKGVYAYGDDLIIPTEAYETCCEVLTAFGHKVNKRKSYFTGSFRESCGMWAFAGSNVTPVFWPRQIPGKQNWEMAATLATLERQFMEWERTRRFISTGSDSYVNTKLTELISVATKTLFPQMTSTIPGQDCDDLWDAETGLIESCKSRHFQRISMWETPNRLTADGTQKRDRDLLDHWTYYEYLQRGPKYDSKLDELLHVSSPRLDYRSATHTPQETFSLRFIR